MRLYIIGTNTYLNQTMAKKKDDIPEWVTDEIKNAKFGKPEQLTRNGYVLEVYDKDNKIDAQFYDSVEDGRTIVTLDLSKKIKMNELEKGVVYEFKFDSLKAPLDKKVIEYLKTEKDLEMDAIYQFELTEITIVDDGSR